MTVVCQFELFSCFFFLYLEWLVWCLTSSKCTLQIFNRSNNIPTTSSFLTKWDSWLVKARGRMNELSTLRYVGFPKAVCTSVPRQKTALFPSENLRDLVGANSGEWSCWPWHSGLPWLPHLVYRWASQIHRTWWKQIGSQPAVLGLLSQKCIIILAVESLVQGIWDPSVLVSVSLRVSLPHRTVDLLKMVTSWTSMWQLETQRIQDYILGVSKGCCLEVLKFQRLPESIPWVYIIPPPTHCKVLLLHSKYHGESIFSSSFLHGSRVRPTFCRY